MVYNQYKITDNASGESIVIVATSDFVDKLLEKLTVYDYTISEDKENEST